MRLKSIVRSPGRLVHSATLMSWLATAVRTGGNGALIFLIAIKLAPAEIAIMLVLLTINSVYVMAEIGLSALFSRMYAYGFAGATPEALFSDTPSAENGGGGAPRWDTIRTVFDLQRVIFSVIALVTLLVAGILGTWLLLPQIAALKLPANGWLSWGVVIFSATIQLRGRIYADFLLGAEQLAIQKRYESLVLTGSSLLAVICLLVFPSLLLVVAIYFGAPVILVAINAMLAHRVHDRMLKNAPRSSVQWGIVKAMWPQAWRMATGVMLGQILFNFGALAIVRNEQSLTIARLLFSLRLLRIIDSFAVTPLITRLPRMARLYYQGKMQEFGHLVERSLEITLPILIVPGVLIAWFGQTVLSFLGSKVSLLPPEYWVILLAGFVALRFGSIFMQLLTVQNRIVWHIANGGTGAVFLISLAVFGLWWAPEVSYPAAFCAANIFVYAPYAVMQTYSLLTVRIRVKSLLIAACSLFVLMATVLCLAFF